MCSSGWYWKLLGLIGLQQKKKSYSGYRKYIVYIVEAVENVIFEPVEKKSVLVFDSHRP